MKKLITVVLLLTSGISSAQQEVHIDRVELNPVLYQANILPLLKDLEQMLNVDLQGQQPKIYTAPREQIAQAYCDKEHNCSVAAVTDRNTGEIYIIPSLIINNLGAASVVFHELVHWVQVTHGWWNNDPDCVKWAKQEMQAYKLQGIWLASNGARSFLVPDLISQCK